MSKRRGPWWDARRAWERLNGWHQDGPSAAPGHPDDGPAAVEALADISLLRHLLDQAELVAVRTARRHGKSWAEIAVNLGVTRQSAWERWRDLDDEAANKTSASPPSTGPQSMETRSRVELVLDDAVAELEVAATEVVGRRARELRRKSTVVVPNVIGRPWREALRVLAENELLGVGSDPEGQPGPASSGPDRMVIDQSPESGAKVAAGSRVTLWHQRGGGSAGVREPRQPKPSPKTARERRYEPADEAIG
jgi:hypothetical protein